jgi:TolB protein
MRSRTVSRRRAMAYLMLVSAVLHPQAAQAAPAMQSNVAHELAFVRDGNILVARAGVERQLTRDGGAARPRWAPDGKRIAYLVKNRLWVMNADGTGSRRLSGYASGGADWSPDGRWLAFMAPGCVGGPAVYRLDASARTPKPEVLFPAECKGQPLPAERPTPARGTLAERIAKDDAVSWSPDGKRIAFRGGQCEAVYDACLTVGTIAGAAEEAFAVFGGGGQRDGFAAVPSWRPDGARLTWTAVDGGTLRLVEFDPAAGTKRTLGVPGDRELSYLTARTAFLTGERDGRSWVFQLDTGSNTRVPVRKGSQPDPRPLKS